MTAIMQAAIGCMGGRKLTIDDIPATVTDLGSSTTTYRAELEFELDGELQERLLVGSDTDLGSWVLPEVEARTTDAVKRVYISGDNTSYTSGTPANDTYVAISIARRIGIEHTSAGGPDEITTNLDIYLAEDTGGTGAVGPASVAFNVGELF